MTNDEFRLRALAREHGMGFVNLNEVVIPQNIIELVPESVARENAVLPLAVDDGTLKVIMSDPLDFDTREKLRFILNRNIEVALAPRDMILKSINQLFGNE